MPGPPSLFPKPPPAESTLTAQLREALRLVRETEGGLTDTQVGYHLHRMAEHHRCTCNAEPPEYDPCTWAKSRGAEALSRLRELNYGLVRRQEGGIWEVPGTTPKPGHSGPGELPEGF